MIYSVQVQVLVRVLTHFIEKRTQKGGNPFVNIYIYIYINIYHEDILSLLLKLMQTTGHDSRIKVINADMIINSKSLSNTINFALIFFENTSILNFYHGNLVAWLFVYYSTLKFKWHLKLGR